MVFIITLNWAAIKDDVIEVKTEILETVDTCGGSIRLVDKEATTVWGSTTVTFVEDTEIDVVIQLLNSNVQEHLNVVLSCNLKSDIPM